MSEPKPLTAAQQRTLTDLNNAAITAQGNLERFVAYLRDEHGAPAPGWQLRDIRVGFEQIAPDEEA